MYVQLGPKGVTTDPDAGGMEECARRTIRASR